LVRFLTHLTQFNCCVILMYFGEFFSDFLDLILE
jgi:hypothetical protein